MNDSRCTIKKPITGHSGTDAPIFYRREVNYYRYMSTCFMEHICGKTFIVNAMSSKDAKRAQEEVMKAIITKEAMKIPTNTA